MKWMELCTGIHWSMLIMILMLILSIFLSVKFFGQICAQNLKFSKLIEILYWSTLLLAYCDFNGYFFKILSSNALQIDWNLIQQHFVICWFFKVFGVRVLARSYLMTLHITFQIHVSFPICLGVFLKWSLIEKMWIVLPYLKKLFFQKGTFMVLYMYVAFD